MLSKGDEGIELEARLRVLLPETYELFDDEVQPRSMGSAGLKYGTDGKVLWNEMWGSFCDLAMAGGPPHRGKLLEPPYADREDVELSPYRQVSDEICRGISLVTGLYAEQSPTLGRVRMYCLSAAMTGWLLRAIVMENVSANAHGLALELPTGSTFRLEKEVKNVITVVAKTCHYWQDHMSTTKHEEVAALLAKMEREGPLVQAVPAQGVQEIEAESLARLIAEDIYLATGLAASSHDSKNWTSFDCREISAAIWMMRALVVNNVLSRREGTVVLIPVPPVGGEPYEQSLRAVIRAHRLAQSYQVLP